MRGGRPLAWGYWHGMAKRTPPLCSLALLLAGAILAFEGRAADAAGMPGGSATAAPQGDPDQALSFDRDFLSMGGAGEEKLVDLSYFAHKGGMQPGRYAVQVKVNDKMVDDGRLVTFKSWPDRPGKLYACVTPAQLLEWWGIEASSKGDVASPKPATVASGGKHSPAPGVRDGAVGPSPASTATDVEKSAAQEPDEPSMCPVGGVVAMVPYANEVFDFNKRLLSLTVPQASLGPASRMRTSPHLWNEGLPAALMNYNYNGSQQHSQGRKSGSDFLGINGQMNVLGWRVRNDLTWHKSQGEGAELNASQVYAQKDFSSLGGGQLTVGHTTSSGGGVDSVSFVGVKLESDGGMLDPKFTTYSPAITGIANSPATVTVRQYGKVIYQQNVPQGPFSLTDFNRSGNGDVEVEIRESDGSTRRFTMASASSGALVRQGALTYSASSGQASDSRGYAYDTFVQAGASYGVWANTTLTGGVLLSKNYQEVSVGTGVYAGPLGAATYTLNTSRADVSVVPGRDGVETGVSHDVSWSRSFGDTSVGLSASRSQNANYHTYSDLLGMEAVSAGGDDNDDGGTRDSLSLTLSQPLGEWGSVSLSGTRSTSWGSSAVQKNLSLSYNTTVKDIGVGVSLGVNTYSGSDNSNNNDGNNNSGFSHSSQDDKTDKTIAVNISLPLGKWLNANSVSGSYSYSKYNGQASQQAGLSGAALNGALSYSVSQGLTGSKTGNTSVGYSGGYGSVTGGYAYGGGSNSVSYGVNGGLAIHPHGITLGKQLALSGGNALVEIPDVGGVNVGNAVTDWRGYALMSGLTPYDINRVSVDVANLPGNVELDASSKNVVPTRGALVEVPFKSNKGYRLLVNLTRDKESVPFGSTAVLMQDDSSGALPVTGIVGDAGQVYMSGMPEKGTVTVSWGDGEDEQCSAAYALPEKTDMTRLNTVAAVCR